MIERIVAYDHATRNGDGDYAPVVRAILGYLNGGTGNAKFQIEYDADLSQLHLRCKAPVRLTIRTTWGSNECLLRFLPFRFLSIETERLFLNDLAGLQIETLDLSRCQSVVAARPVELPRLRRLILPAKGTNTPVVDQIRSNEQFELAQHP